MAGPSDQPRGVPAVRVLPMSDRLPGFRGRTIERVQAEFFRGRLLKAEGRYRYATSGLNAPRGTAVLFQFKARVIASAILLADERLERPVRGCAGILHFAPAMIRTFDPVDAAAMRRVWPAFRRFGHAKFMLNPGQWPVFERTLAGVTFADAGADR